MTELSTQLVFSAVNSGVVLGLFYRLGQVTTMLKNYDRRIEILEQK